MSASAIFAAVLSILKLIPALQKWTEDFVAWYINQRIDTMAAENRDAIRKAVIEHDQRDLEKATGNPHAGDPSGIPGTVIRDTLPGLSGGGLPK